MNRTSLKILVLVCIPAAAILWLTGFILFGQPGNQETDCLNHAKIIANTGTLLSDDANKLWLAFGHAASVDKANPSIVNDDAKIEAREEWEQAMTKVHVNQDELDSWIGPANRYRAVRQAQQSKFNHASLAFAGAALLFSVLLFITIPSQILEAPSKN